MSPEASGDEGRRSQCTRVATAPRRPPGTEPPSPEGGFPSKPNHTPPGPALGRAAAEEQRVPPGIRGRAGPGEGGDSLAAVSNRRSLFSMVPARPSWARHFRFPLKARGARRRSVRPSIKGNEGAGPWGGRWAGPSGGRGGGGAKGALWRHVTGTRRSSVGHFRWSAAAPLKRRGGEEWPPLLLNSFFFFPVRPGQSESARRARVGGEGGRPGRGAGAFAATRAPCLVCLAR